MSRLTRLTVVFAMTMLAQSQCYVLFCNNADKFSPYGSDVFFSALLKRSVDSATCVKLHCSQRVVFHIGYYCVFIVDRLLGRFEQGVDFCFGVEHCVRMLFFLNILLISACSS